MERAATLRRAMVGRGAQVLKFPSEIPVAFALPFQIKLALALTLFLQLSLLFLTRIGRAAPKHLAKSVADGVGACILNVFIRPKITPRNARQTLFDLVLVHLLRLPPCDGAQRRQTGADMSLPLFPGLCVSLTRQLQPLAHFREHDLRLTHCMHPRAPLGQGFIVAALSLGGKLFAPLDGISGGAKLQLRLAVQLFGAHVVTKGQRLFALHLQGPMIDALLPVSYTHLTLPTSDLV